MIKIDVKSIKQGTPREIYYKLYRAHRVAFSNPKNWRQFARLEYLLKDNFSERLYRSVLEANGFVDWRDSRRDPMSHPDPIVGNAKKTLAWRRMQAEKALEKPQTHNCASQSRNNSHP